MGVSRRITIDLYQYVAVVALDCTSICAILGTAYFYFGIWSWHSISAVLVLFTIAQILFRDRSTAFASHTPTYQWRNKNVWTPLNGTVLADFAYYLFIMLDFATVTCIQKVLIFTAAQNLPLSTEIWIMSLGWQVIKIAFKVSRILYAFYGTLGRDPLKCEVDVLGISERKPGNLYTYSAIRLVHSSLQTRELRHRQALAISLPPPLFELPNYIASAQCLQR